MLDGGPAVPRDVATATNFGPQFAIIGFVLTNAGDIKVSRYTLASLGVLGGAGQTGLVEHAWTCRTK